MREYASRYGRKTKLRLRNENGSVIVETMVTRYAAGGTPHAMTPGQARALASDLVRLADEAEREDES